MFKLAVGRSRASIRPLNELTQAELMHLRAASGWLELGDRREAEKELENLTEESRSHPDVLELRWQICAKAAKWETCLDISEALVKVAPKRQTGWLHCATSYHKLKRTEDAHEALLPAAVRFPKDWRVRYELARYACLLGKAEEGRDWLHQAFEVGDQKQLRQLALDDPDFAAIWVRWPG